MKAFLRTAGYLFRAQLRSPLFYVLLAAVLGCAALPLFEISTEAKAAIICDEDGTALSRSLIAQAMESRSMALREVREGELPNALNRVRNGTVEAVFVINAGYENSIINGEYKGVLSLYLSPYSTSSRTFADSVAAIVMSQWLERAAVSAAQNEMGPAAAMEAQRLFSQGSQPIMLLRVEGEPGSSASPGAGGNHAAGAFFPLSALTCFLMLCLVHTNREEREGLLERFKSRGWSASAYTFARPAVWAIAVAAASSIPVVWIAVSEGPAAGLHAFLPFIFYLATWLGVSAALSALARGPAAQLAFAAVLAILNAIFSYPLGLFQSAGVVRFIVPGWWLTQALGQAGDWLMLLPLGAFALGAVGVGILVSKLKINQPF